MVVLQHESLHQTLWGPAAQRGRTRATDAGIYLQTALYALLGVCSALEFNQPEAVRLGAAAVATVFYFRNTALFVRLELLLACLMLYGDVILPIRRLAGSPHEVVVLPATKLGLHCVALWNSVRILFAIFSSGALRKQQGLKRVAKPGVRYQRREKTA